MDRSGEISADELIGPLLSLGAAHSLRQVHQMIQTVDFDGAF